MVHGNVYLIALFTCCLHHCYRSHYHISASLFIVLHDFLDHLDGIVAKVHRRQYGLVDSPMLGSFLDAFCDKVCTYIYRLDLET